MSAAAEERAREPESSSNISRILRKGPKGWLPWRIHPHCDDGCVDGGEGQLLELLSFILGWKWHVAFLPKVRFQVKDAADAGAGLDQRDDWRVTCSTTTGGPPRPLSFWLEVKDELLNLITVTNIGAPSKCLLQKVALIFHLSSSTTFDLLFVFSYLQSPPC